MTSRIFWCLLLLTIVFWSPRAYGETAVVTISPPLSEHSEQPEITRIEPLGGKVGDTITIYGKNFGDDRKKIKIQFIDLETKNNKEIKPIEPVFLAKVPDKEESEIRFMTEERHLLDNHLVEKIGTNQHRCE